MGRMIIAIIPARWGSTRFPGKPLALIQGKTMIRRVWERAKAAPLLSRVIIATDDERIASHVLEFGGEVVMTGDCQTGSDRLAAVLVQEPLLLEARVIVNIQGDEPLIEPAFIERVALALCNDIQSDIATGVIPILAEEGQSRSVVKCVFDRNQRALYFSRSVIPHGAKVLHKHLGIYAYRPESLLRFAALAPTPLQVIEELEQLRALENGMCIRVEIFDDSEIGHLVAVDTPQDIAKVEEVLCKANSSLLPAVSALLSEKG